MTNLDAPILDRLSSLADATRGRILLILEGHELTVGELCSVLQLPQSTVSRQLKVLADEGWVRSRSEGTTRHYRLRVEQLEASSAALWQIVRQELARTAGAQQDARRLTSVIDARRVRSREFFGRTAGDWDGIREELFGSHVELRILPALLSANAVIGDLGCGTGAMSAALAPFVHRVVAVDESPAMLQAARARLASRNNVDLREGKLESLPITDGELDAALLLLVLHHIEDPAIVLKEAARTLRQGGRLVIADMTPHDRVEYAETMGHLWMGFEPEQMAGWMKDAGLGEINLVDLSPDRDAEGPALFVAVGIKS